jgi:hypothetical protein
LPKIKAVTGVGITTSVAMESADLGILRWDEQRGAVAAMFGDNFEFWKMQGEWQSPSIVMYDNDFNVLGVPTKDGIEPNGRRKQLFEYPHNNPDYTTILPCDFIRLGDWWYAALMVTAGLGHEKRTVFWRSKDLYDWVKTDPYIRLDHQDDQGNPINHPGNTMLTFDVMGDYVYTFGTGGLSRDRGIWLWRSKIDEFPYDYFEPWGMDGDQRWNWGTANELTPIISGRYGELCFRNLQSNCVLSFFDEKEYCQTALSTLKPNDDWSTANSVNYATGMDFPQLYGGYIAPSSKLNEPNGMKFLVSQWNTANNDPYHVVQFDDTLQAKGPLVEPELRLAPQQMYDLLLKELSVSGSIPIVTPDGQKISLRAAIGQIYLKECGLYDLKGRPHHPSKPDVQLGHLQSLRAENLFTQALMVALADHYGLDTAAIYQQVQEVFK